MERELPSVDELVVNLLALAEVVPRLSAERLAPLARHAPDLARLVGELDAVGASLPPRAPGLPEPVWARLRATCAPGGELGLAAGRLAVDLYDAPGFRAAKRAWRPLAPERVNLDDGSLATWVEEQGQEEIQPGGVGGLSDWEDTPLGRVRRLTDVTRLALEHPAVFAADTGQLVWLARLLGAEWPRPGAPP